VHDKPVSLADQRSRFKKVWVYCSNRLPPQRRSRRAGLIHHSDRGVQYASAEYRKLLHSAGFQASMSRRADCYDNAPMESFFHTLKTELIHHRHYATRQEARRR
jgi:transposase InsO family protein